MCPLSFLGGRLQCRKQPGRHKTGRPPLLGTVLGPQDLGHLLWGLAAAVMQPLFDDGVEAVPKKLDMVIDIAVAVVGGCLAGIVLGDPERAGAARVLELKIRLVKKLILIDVTKELVKVVAVILLLPLILIQLGHLPLQFFLHGVGQIEDIEIAGVKSGAVDTGDLADGGDGDLIELGVLQQLYKGGLYFCLRRLLGVFRAVSPLFIIATDVGDLMIVPVLFLHYTGYRRPGQVL